MPGELPAIIVITGLMAAGKSSVAQALAERLPRSVHLRGDVFRKMIVHGREEMSGEPSPRAVAQLEARYDLACDAARAYAGLGFTVLHQDVILGPYLQRVLDRLKDLRPGALVLTPSLEVLAERDATRAKTGYGTDWSPATLAPGLQALPRIGLWLDTTMLSLEQTVDAVLRNGSRLRAGMD